MGVDCCSGWHMSVGLLVGRKDRRTESGKNRPVEYVGVYLGDWLCQPGLRDLGAKDK